ncbi:MAG: hemerythrin family protein [Nitrospirae bacterium]|nr:hemerythrin family protein [Nitrospirota bacterium]
MAIEWTEDLSVGIEEIDMQHKEIFKMAANLIDAVNNNTDGEQLAKAIKFLEEYVVLHFALEESFMVQSKYPSKLLLQHEEQHTEFWEKFNDFKNEFAGTGPTEFYLTRFKLFLNDWLVNHICKVDKSLGDVMRSVKHS